MATRSPAAVATRAAAIPCETTLKPPGAGHGHGLECLENADNGAEQPDEGRGRSHGAECPQKSSEARQRHDPLRIHCLGRLVRGFREYAQAAAKHLTQGISSGFAQGGSLGQVAFLHCLDHTILEMPRIWEELSTERRVARR